ncbi:hypothetical protein BH10PSE19_BH10PSE19_10180 [soil metagenome]
MFRGAAKRLVSLRAAVRQQPPTVTRLSPAQVTVATVHSYGQIYRSTSSAAPAKKLPVSPNIIFGESHHDNATPKVLLKLEIKNFKNEAKATESLDDQLQEIEHMENLFPIMERFYKKHGLDILNPEHFDVFAKIMIKKDGETPETYQMLQQLYGVVDRYGSKMIYKKLFENFKKNNTSYEGIDLDFSESTLEKTMALTQERSAYMADKYLKASGPFVAVNGLLHIAAIQGHIRDKLPPRQASAFFSWFHIYSTDFSEGFGRVGRAPLGLTSINLNKTLVEDAVKIIEMQTKKKEEELLALEHDQPQTIYDMAKCPRLS